MNNRVLQRSFQGWKMKNGCIRFAAGEEGMKARKRIEMGQHLVADPEICHGQLTFKGTRIMVKDVLDMVAKGWDWDRISAAYD